MSLVTHYHCIPESTINWNASGSVDQLVLAFGSSIKVLPSIKVLYIKNYSRIIRPRAGTIGKNYIKIGT